MWQEAGNVTVSLFFRSHSVGLIDTYISKIFNYVKMGVIEKINH